jgi:hypothetical protein
MKKLKVGDVVNAVFLSEPNECEVIEVINKHVYKLMMNLEEAFREANAMAYSKFSTAGKCQSH